MDNDKKWPTSDRINNIGLNGNTGEHYLDDLSFKNYNCKLLSSDQKIQSLENKIVKLKKKNTELSKKLKSQTANVARLKSLDIEHKSQYRVLKQKYIEALENDK